MTDGGNRGKPKAGSPCFHHPGESQKSRFPHSHSADDFHIFQFTEPQSRALTDAPQTPKQIPSKGANQSSNASALADVSGPPRIGINGDCQAHRALESISCFRPIYGLENAARAWNSTFACFENALATDVRFEDLNILAVFIEAELDDIGAIAGSESALA